MKISMHLLALLALGGTFSFAEEGGKNRNKPDGDGDRPAGNPQEIFKRLDKDGSGGVSLDEFKSSPKGQENPKRAAKLFAHIDADGDGQLTMDEFAKMHRPGGGGGDHPNPEEIFKQLDTDGSGGVSLEEFKAGPRSQKNPEKAGEIFGKIDADSDGQLTIHELARFHAEHRGDDGKGKGGKGGGNRPDGDRPDGGNRPDKGNDGGNVE